MGNKIGRNDPCPCGSGLKHKRCCLQKTVTAPNLAPPARSVAASEPELDERLTRALLSYAFNRFGDAWTESARRLFPGSKDPYHDQIFIPWAMYCYEYKGRRLADWFLDENLRSLTRDERRWLDAQMSTPLSIWEITGVDEGTGLHLLDQLTGEQCFVQEVEGSYRVQPHDVMLARVCHHGSRSLVVGGDPRPLPPMPAMYVVQRARQRIGLGQDGRTSRTDLNDAAAASVLIALWQEAISQIARQPAPRMQNTDGDDLLLTTEHFAFDPTQRQRVVAKIADFQGAELDDGARDADVTVYRIVRPPRHGMTDDIVMARLEIQGRRLRVETNSRKRTVAIRRRLRRALGDVLERAERVHSDPESLFREAPPVQPSPTPSPPPGALDLVRQFKEQHYGQWPELPLPALDGKTPREAASDVLRRPVLAALIKDIEQQENRLPQEGRFDCAPLWRLLDG